MKGESKSFFIAKIVFHFSSKKLLEPSGLIYSPPLIVNSNSCHDMARERMMGIAIQQHMKNCILLTHLGESNYFGCMHSFPFWSS